MEDKEHADTILSGTSQIAMSNNSTGSLESSCPNIMAKDIDDSKSECLESRSFDDQERCADKLHNFSTDASEEISSALDVHRKEPGVVGELQFLPSDSFPYLEVGRFPCDPVNREITQALSLRPVESKLLSSAEDKTRPSVVPAVMSKSTVLNDCETLDKSPKLEIKKCQILELETDSVVQCDSESSFRLDSQSKTTVESMTSLTEKIDIKFPIHPETDCKVSPPSEIQCTTLPSPDIHCMPLAPQFITSPLCNMSNMYSSAKINSSKLFPQLRESKTPLCSMDEANSTSSIVPMSKILPLDESSAPLTPIVELKNPPPIVTECKTPTTIGIEPKTPPLEAVSKTPPLEAVSKTLPSIDFETKTPPVLENQSTTPSSLQVSSTFLPSFESESDGPLIPEAVCQTLLLPPESKILPPSVADSKTLPPLVADTKILPNSVTHSNTQPSSVTESESLLLPMTGFKTLPPVVANSKTPPSLEDQSKTTPPVEAASETPFSLEAASSTPSLIQAKSKLSPLVTESKTPPPFMIESKIPLGIEYKAPPVVPELKTSLVYESIPPLVPEPKLIVPEYKPSLGPKSKPVVSVSKLILASESKILPLTVTECETPSLMGEPEPLCAAEFKTLPPPVDESKTSPPDIVESPSLPINESHIPFVSDCKIPAFRFSEYETPPPLIESRSLPSATGSKIPPPVSELKTPPTPNHESKTPPAVDKSETLALPLGKSVSPSPVCEFKTPSPPIVEPPPVGECKTLPPVGESKISLHPFVESENLSSPDRGSETPPSAYKFNMSLFPKTNCKTYTAADSKTPLAATESQMQQPLSISATRTTTKMPSAIVDSETMPLNTIKCKISPSSETGPETPAPSITRPEMLPLSTTETETPPIVSICGNCPSNNNNLISTSSVASKCNDDKIVAKCPKLCGSSCVESDEDMLTIDENLSHSDSSEADDFLKELSIKTNASFLPDLNDCIERNNVEKKKPSVDNSNIYDKSSLEVSSKDKCKNTSANVVKKDASEVCSVDNTAKDCRQKISNENESLHSKSHDNKMKSSKTLSKEKSTSKEQSLKVGKSNTECIKSQIDLKMVDKKVNVLEHKLSNDDRSGINNKRHNISSSNLKAPKTNNSEHVEKKQRVVGKIKKSNVQKRSKLDKKSMSDTCLKDKGKEANSSSKMNRDKVTVERKTVIDSKLQLSHSDFKDGTSPKNRSKVLAISSATHNIKTSMSKSSMTDISVPKSCQNSSKFRLHKRVQTSGKKRSMNTFVKACKKAVSEPLIVPDPNSDLIITSVSSRSAIEDGFEDNEISDSEENGPDTLEQTKISKSLRCGRKSATPGSKVDNPRLSWAVRDDTKEIICSLCHNIWNHELFYSLFKKTCAVTVQSRITYGAVYLMYHWATKENLPDKDRAIFSLLDRADLSKNLRENEIISLVFWIRLKLLLKEKKCCDVLAIVYGPSKMPTKEQKHVLEDLSNNSSDQKKGMKRKLEDVDTVHVKRKSLTKNDTDAQLSTFSDLPQIGAKRKALRPSNIVETHRNVDTDVSSDLDLFQFSGTNSKNSPMKLASRGNHVTVSQYTTDVASDAKCYTISGKPESLQSVTLVPRHLGAKDVNELALSNKRKYPYVCAELERLSSDVKDIFKCMPLEGTSPKYGKESQYVGRVTTAREMIALLYLCVPSNMKSVLHDTALLYRSAVQILSARGHILLVPDGRTLLKFVDQLRQKFIRSTSNTKPKFATACWTASFPCIHVEEPNWVRLEQLSVENVLALFCIWKNWSLLSNSVQKRYLQLAKLKYSQVGFRPRLSEFMQSFGVENSQRGSLLKDLIMLYDKYCHYLEEDEERKLNEVLLQSWSHVVSLHNVDHFLHSYDFKLNDQYLLSKAMLVSSDIGEHHEQSSPLGVQKTFTNVLLHDEKFIRSRLSALRSLLNYAQIKTHELENSVALNCRSSQTVFVKASEPKCSTNEKNKTYLDRSFENAHSCSTHTNSTANAGSGKRKRTNCPETTEKRIDDEQIPKYVEDLVKYAYSNVTNFDRSAIPKIIELSFKAKGIENQALISKLQNNLDKILSCK